MHFFSVPRGAIDTGALVVCTLFFFQAGIYFEVRMDTVPIAICKKVYRKNEFGKNNNDRISGYLETCLPRENRSSFWVVSGPSSPFQAWFFFLRKSTGWPSSTVWRHSRCAIFYGVFRKT